MWAVTLNLLEYAGECLLYHHAPTVAWHPEVVRGLEVRSGIQVQACMQAQAM